MSLNKAPVMPFNLNLREVIEAEMDNSVSSGVSENKLYQRALHDGAAGALPDGTAGRESILSDIQRHKVLDEFHEYTPESERQIYDDEPKTRAKLY